MNSSRMPVDRPRRGAAAVEAALVLSAAALLLFGALDVSLAVLRRNLLANAACRGARVAGVHGDRSASPLGPAAWAGTAASAHPVADSIRPLISTIPPAQVQIAISWPDGDRDAGSRVAVELSSQSPSILASLFGTTWTLRAASTVPIAH